MNRLMLKTGGEIVNNGRTVSGSPLGCLNHQLALEEGYTLRSLFRMIDAHPLLAELNEFCPSHLKDFRDAPENGCESDEIEHLELTKTVEMIGFPGKPRLEIYISLYGVQNGEMCQIKSIPLVNLLDMPLTLGRLRHVIFGDKVDIFEFETVFNLFEFIDGVAWELSFHSAPLHCNIRR